MSKLVDRYTQFMWLKEAPTIAADECKNIALAFEDFKCNFKRWTYYEGCYYEHDKDKLECNGNFYTREQLFDKFIDEYYE